MSHAHALPTPTDRLITAQLGSAPSVALIALARGRTESKMPVPHHLGVERASRSGDYA